MRRIRSYFTIFFVGLGFSNPLLAEYTALQHATIHTLGEQGTLADATLVMKDGYIVAVGQHVSIPKGARVINADGLIVTPGIMNAHTYLGLSEITKSSDSNDHSGKGSGLGAAFRVSYGLNYRSDVIFDNRRHGLTQAISNPTGSDDLFLGSGAVLSLTTEVGAVVGQGPMVVDLAVGGNRNAAWGKLYRVFKELRQYAKGKSSGKTYLSAFEMEALLPVLEGQQPLLILVKGEPDIRQAIALKKSYDLHMILSGADEAWRVAKALKEAGIAVLVDARDTLPRSFADLHSTGRNAALLHAAGVKIAIAPTGAGRNHQAHHVLEAAGVAVRYGLPWAAALKAITLAPAQIFGLEKYGMLEKGKVANLVIWDGDPLEVTTNPKYVFINGQDVVLVSHRVALRDKYLNLETR